MLKTILAPTDDVIGKKCWYFTDVVNLKFKIQDVQFLFTSFKRAQKGYLFEYVIYKFDNRTSK